jgi:hypothetical protein
MRSKAVSGRGANRPLLVGVAAAGILCLAILDGIVASQGRGQPAFTTAPTPGSDARSAIGPAASGPGPAPPSPSPGPTPTFQPPLDAAELAYVNWADLSGVAMDVSAGLVIGLIDSPRLDDRVWRQGMMAELAAWKRIGQEAAVQSAPPALYGTHTRFLAGMDHFATAAALVNRAIEGSEPSLLVPAEAEMRDGLRQIGQVEAALSALLRKRGLKA